MKDKVQKTKAEKTRSFIIETSAPLFNKNGYRGTSLSQLTEATGLTKGAIYGNFKNKDEIAVEALKYNHSVISDAIAKVVIPIDNMCDKLIAFAKFYDDHYFFISGTGGCPILNSAVDFDDGDKKLKTVVKGLIDEWRGAVKGIVKKGIRKGEIKKDVDYESFATTFVALIEGGIMMSKITDDSLNLSYTVEQIIDIVENKLREID
ncbi:MAG: TetR/AcrR family transcriptional regulator [Desulfobacterales bacterium]|nr:TetR/AcrR family transcriptional regulator [Desulfobacterales bacterium]MCP4161376.1 TetR/AcrR family transcriptional regulator [Deltaproteobacteria bacterium]